MNRIFYVLSCALALALATSAHAGFFIPKDTTMFMGMYSPDAQSLEIAHGFSRALSIAAVTQRYRSDDRTLDRRFTLLQGAYLLDRGYYTDGVANLYLYGGPFSVRSDESDGTGSGLNAGLWADYETRRVYVRASSQTYRAQALHQTIATAQALWAPYAADYEDIATWFGVQLQRRQSLSDETQVTPLLRLFQRNWWVDAGASVNRDHRGEAFINVMFLF